MGRSARSRLQPLASGPRPLVPNEYKLRRYNRYVTFRYIPLVFAGLLLTGCSRGIQNEAAVRQGIIDYLSTKSGLNVSSIQVAVASVSFRQNEADAVVSFRPKGGGPGSGIEMRYTLERKGNRWVVKGRGAGAHGQMPAGQMGAGQPPAQVGGHEGLALPPGHPPLSSGAPSGANR